MKHFLRLMGQLCPLSNQYKIKLTAMVAVTTLFMCLIAAFKAPAQTGAAANMDEIQPLQIGDTIPEALWHLPLQVVNHPEGRDTITLNDYRDKKLIILDFWATWCKPCIKSVMLLDTIAAELEGQNIALLPVQVYDLVSNAQRFIEKWDWHLPTIVGDTLLNKVAFYNYLTGFGVVWIADGKLLAVPQSKDVNKENVVKALRREPLYIEHRKGYPLLTQ